jgi:hypothetical protein
MLDKLIMDNLSCMELDILQECFANSLWITEEDYIPGAFHP